MSNYRNMSIGECLADRDARNAFALATGYPLVDMDTEKSARRARYERRKVHH